MYNNVISSKDNSKIKFAARLLTSARARRENNSFIAEGLRLCRDAVENGVKPQMLFFTPSLYEKHPEELEKLKSVSESAYEVSEDVFLKISDTVSPQGVAAVCSIPEMKFCGYEKGLYVGLENTQNPANLGAIARTAEAFGVKGILISDVSCDPFSPKTLRAGMGAILRLPIIVCPDFCEEVKNFRLSGTVYGSVINNADCDISDVLPDDTSLLLIGNEANGLSEKVLSEVDKRVTIPMYGRAESLNASTAAAVLIWELTKRK